MNETKLENGQVVQTQTTSIEVGRFIENKQQEIKMLQDQIKMTNDRLTTVLAELSKLLK